MICQPMYRIFVLCFFAVKLFYARCGYGAENALPTVLQAPPTVISTCAGSRLLLEIVANNVDNVAWFENDVLLSAQNSLVLTITSVKAVAKYYAVLSNSFGSVTTDVITVVGNPIPNVGTGIVIEACLGAEVTLAGTGAVSYVWSGGVQDRVPFITTSTGLRGFTVIGTDANGCTASGTALLITYRGPTIRLTPNPFSICVRDTVQFRPSPGLNYQWPPGVFVNNLFAVTTSGTNFYVVTVTNQQGCASTETFTLTGLSLPTVTGSASKDTVCKNETIIFTGAGGNNYVWGVGPVNGIPYAITQAGVNTFTVTGFDANNCRDNDVVTVFGRNLPIVNANPSQAAVCQGFPLSLTGAGTAKNYFWNSGIENHTLFTPTGVGLRFYTLTGIDSVGCSNIAVATVTVWALPNIRARLTENLSPICENSFISLTATGGTSYFWRNNVSPGATFQPPKGRNVYYVTGTDANGCSNIDSLVIQVIGIPTSTQFPALLPNTPLEINYYNNQPVCVPFTATHSIPGATLAFEAESLQPRENIRLISTSGNSFLIENGLCLRNCWQSNTNEEWVKVRVQAQACGLRLADSLTYRVSISDTHSTPKILILPQENIVATVGSAINWQATVENGQTLPTQLFVQTPGFTPTAFGMNTQINGLNYELSWLPSCNQYLRSSNYTFQFWAVKTGCKLYLSDTLTIRMFLTDPESRYNELPNIITPNNDGINDYFFIDEYIKNRCEEPFRSIEIYNRWGNKVYSSSQYGFRWDASNVADGIYFYAIKTALRTITGYLAVVR